MSMILVFTGKWNRPTRNPRTALQTKVIAPTTRGQVRPAKLMKLSPESVRLPNHPIAMEHQLLILRGDERHLFEREQRNGNNMQLELMYEIGRANATSSSADRTARMEEQ